MKRYYYFAYGSNMDTERMLARCPGARLVGPASLPDYRLVERLYADIEPTKGFLVEGLLWSVTRADLESLNRYEGVENGIYRNRVYKVGIGGEVRKAYGYEMTPQTRRVRDGQSFPAWYRAICKRGAVAHGVGGFFGTTKKGA